MLIAGVTVIDIPTCQLESYADYIRHFNADCNNYIRPSNLGQIHLKTLQQPD